MKTFSKALSMILVVVMCFGLFTMSAFAGDFTFNDSDDTSFGGDFNASFGDNFSDGGFTFNDGGSTGGDFAINDSPAPVQPANNGGFALDTGDEPAQQQTEPAKSEEELTFSFGETEAFDKRYVATDNYTFTINPTSVDKTDPKDVSITSMPKIEPDTFDSYAYTMSGAYTNPTTITETNLIKTDGKITIKANWLKNLNEGTYYLWGIPALGSPAYLGYIQVNSGDFGKFTVSNSPYTQYAKPFNPVTVTGNIKLLARFGVVPVTNTSAGEILTSGIDYNASDTQLVFTQSLLDSLKAGEYYIVGFPSATSTANQVQMGKMTIKAGEDGHGTDPWGNDWVLEPNYYTAWTSGDDMLVFYSNLMAYRKYTQYHSVFLRYGIGAGSIPNRTVDVNSWWDREDGTFLLGTNFLNSLSSGTYTLQVIDLKTAACTNTVEFRIGAKLRPIDSDKHVINSIKNLRYLCDDPVSQVYVGNIPLTYGEDYALSADRRTITLSFEFLNKRSAGNTYTIKALTDYGDMPSSTFQILTTAQGSASPRTGDESNLGLWAAFLLLSGAAVVVLVPKLRKHDF